MPLYSFLCKNCRKEFEIFVSEYSVPVPACPKCKSENVKRIWDIPTISFKGTGFYATDKEKK
jgi:putative FmdB family regulatory protein